MKPELQPSDPAHDPWWTQANGSVGVPRAADPAGLPDLSRLPSPSSVAPPLPGPSPMAPQPAAGAVARPEPVFVLCFGRSGSTLLRCLYRHPMDVIASGIEASPWGLNGFGFDAFAASSPGNAVLALAQFWADNTAAILAVEQRFLDRCHRVRYEDLVAGPEKVAAGIFRFLGVPAAPGISERCFTAERERLGPADYKIWHTSRISADSVGRGWSIPASLIGPAVTATVNDLAAKRIL